MVGGGSRKKGLGFRVWGLRFGIWVFGFRAWGLGFGVQGFGFERHTCTPRLCRTTISA